MAKKTMVMITLSFIFLLYLPSTTMAKGFFEHQDTVISENQTVNDVVVVGGDATVSGKVKNFVIVFNGDAIIKSTAHIKGMVLVIGGTIIQAPGAVIENDILSISLDNSTKNSLLIGSGLLASVWILQLFGSLLLIALPMLLVFFLKQRIQPFVQLVRDTSGRALGVGFFSSLLVIAISLLLFITVIGTPIILIILLSIALCVLLGVTALGLILGEKVQMIIPRKQVWVTTGISAAVIVSLMNIPIVGILIMLGVMWLSLGMVTMWAFGKLKKRRPK
ncbi:MAG: hypothetical protein WD469_13955 [Paenibacillaceae bacterium]